MSNLSLRRHLEIFDPQQHPAPITIIGAGATGSRLWLSLVELGITNITVIDFDVVEAHNLANQVYLHKHIGTPKVSALREYYTQKTGATSLPQGMTFLKHKVTADSFIKMEGNVFLMTDTMHSRRDIFDTFLKGNADVKYVFETRMASTHGNVNAFDPNSEHECAAWVDSLVADDAPEETSACGASISVGPTAAVIANLAVWQFILSCTDPLAMYKAGSVYLKPLIVTTEQTA